MVTFALCQGHMSSEVMILKLSVLTRGPTDLQQGQRGAVRILVRRGRVVQEKPWQLRAPEVQLRSAVQAAVVSLGWRRGNRQQLPECEGQGRRVNALGVRAEGHA